MLDEAKYLVFFLLQNRGKNLMKLKNRISKHFLVLNFWHVVVFNLYINELKDLLA